MATQEAAGFQTGFGVFPSVLVINSSGNWQQQFNAKAGILGGLGVTWGLSPSSLGSITPSGLYTAPSSVSSPSVDQVLATAASGAQAQALVTLTP